MYVHTYTLQSIIIILKSLSSGWIGELGVEFRVLSVRVKIVDFIMIILLYTVHTNTIILLCNRHNNVLILHNAIVQSIDIPSTIITIKLLVNIVTIV